MNCQQREIELLKARIKLQYNWLDDDTIVRCYNMAINDYLMLRYPVENNRPENIELTRTILQWVEIRIMDILSRAGISLSSYRENNLNLTYGASYIDPNIAGMIKPKASVPK